MAVAEPILASTIWTARQPVSNRDLTNEERPTLNTRCRSIDLALQGGLVYGDGGVCCISDGDGGAARDLARSFMASHLLATAEHTATVIDSTLSFDVRKLHQAMASMITLGQHTVDEQSASNTAVEVLSRVKIMKVFDFIGLVEALTEVQMEVDRPAPQLPRGTVGDSEDEEDDPRDANPHFKGQQQSVPASSGALLLIDDITSVAAPLLKRDDAQGQALLCSLMRSLQHLTHTNEICTVILSAANAYPPLLKQSFDAPSVAREAPPSIFPSCQISTALGKSFQWLVDVHLLVHPEPKRESDARALYGEHSKRRTDGKDVELVNVMEVLYDRCGGRFQRWAAFDTDATGLAKDVR